MLGVAPILSSRDLAATSSYGRLGCGDTHLIIRRGDVSLWRSDEDADPLFAEYERLGLPAEGIPRLHGPPNDSDYGLREFALVDPDDNLLRIGSFLGEPPPSKPAPAEPG